MPDEATLRRRRDRSRAAAVVGVLLLMAMSVGFRAILDILAALFGNAGPLGGWILLATFAWTALAILSWMFWGYRLRRLFDPWAYDPDLDGPDPRIRRGLEHAVKAEREDSADSGHR